MKSIPTIVAVILGIIAILSIELVIYNNQPRITPTDTTPNGLAAEQSSPAPQFPEEVDMEMSSTQQLFLDLAQLLSKYRIFFYSIILLIIAIVVYNFSQIPL